MFAVTYKNTRPNTTVNWLNRPPELVELVADLKSQGKLLSEEYTVAPDGLTSIYKSVWNTRQDKDDFDAHPATIEFKNDRINHNKLNGCVTYLIEALEF